MGKTMRRVCLSSQIKEWAMDRAPPMKSEILGLWHVNYMTISDFCLGDVHINKSILTARN